MARFRESTPALDALPGVGELEFSRQMVRWSLATAITAIVIIGINMAVVWHLWHIPKETLVVAVIDDASGRVVWRGTAASTELKDVWVAAQLTEWLRRCRWRPDDLVVLKTWRDQCLNMTDKQALKDMEAFFKATDPNNPQLAGNPPRVKPERFRWVKEGPTMFRFTWVETITPKYGDVIRTLEMTGVMTVEFRGAARLLGPLLKTGDLEKSELGIFVIDFLWNPEKEGPA